MSNSRQLAVPDEVARAVEAEALRRMVRPGAVLTDWLRRTFPQYVAGRLAEDLAHPESGAVVEVEVKNDIESEP